MLLGKNNDNYRQAGISLVLDKDELYEESYYFEEPMSNTVTCTGCATGCHPSMKNKKGICWPPCDPCTKTETLQAGPIFSKSGK